MKKQKNEIRCKTRNCTHPAIQDGLCGIHMPKSKPVIRARVRVPRCSNKDCKQYALLDGHCMFHYKQTVDAEKRGRCYFLGCLQQALHKGLCKKHYRRYQKANTKLCAFQGCCNPRASQGFCHIHHVQFLQQQTLRALRKPSKSPVTFVPVPVTVELLFALNQINPKSRVDAIQTILDEWLQKLTPSEIVIPIESNPVPAMSQIPSLCAGITTNVPQR